MSTTSPPKTAFRSLMDEGNDAYRAAQSITPEALRPPRATRAIRLYGQALDCAKGATERSSAFKNAFKAHLLIVLTDAATPEDRGHHFREGLICVGKALQLAAESQAQTLAWVVEVFSSLNALFEAPQRRGGAFPGFYPVLEEATKRTENCLLVRALSAMELLREAQRCAACRAAAKDYQGMKADIGKVDALAQSLDDFLGWLEVPPPSWPLEVLLAVKEQAGEVALGLAASKREAYSRCHLMEGHAARDRARREAAEEMMCHIYDALDNYRLAILYSAGKDIPLEAEARTSIGAVYCDFLGNKTAAHTHFVEAVQLVHATEPVWDLSDREWFRRAVNSIKDWQEEQVAKDESEREKDEAERKLVLEELKPELDALRDAAAKGHSALLEHIYKTYEPLGVSTPPTEDASGKAYTSHRLAVQLTGCFHPDKAHSPKLKTRVLHEKITRHLTDIINSSKHVD